MSCAFFLGRDFYGQPGRESGFLPRQLGSRQENAQGHGDYAASGRPAQASDYGRCDSRLPSFIVGGTFSGAVSFQALPR